MMKIISKESLDTLIKNLETAEKPVKENFTRREAIEALRPQIRELKKRGFTYKEIAEVITQQSGNELRLRPKEAEEICAGRRRAQNVNEPAQSIAGPLATSESPLEGKSHKEILSRDLDAS